MPKQSWTAFLFNVACLLCGTVVGGLACASLATAGRLRTYFIAADEVEWDYAPSGVNKITDEPFNDAAKTFTEQGKERIGKVYLKAKYREYTDAQFSALKPIPSEWEHLGILGPVIRAEVGDTIEVVFKNNLRFPASVHPHGVFYAKDSEGTPYNDGTSGAEKNDDAVPPGGAHTYRWSVPERAGPGPMDSSSVFWMYHSHIDKPAETNAGLMGPLIITAQGKAKEDGSPVDIDREFVTLFSVFDENASLYLDNNIDKFTGDAAFVRERRLKHPEFLESNLKHAINGFIFGNLPGLTMNKGQRTRWYLMGMGTEVDLHTPHWHGNTGLFMGMRMDMLELLPGSMKVFDMQPDNPGAWLYHCHVNDHIIAGMLAVYTVNP